MMSVLLPCCLILLLVPLVVTEDTILRSLRSPTDVSTEVQRGPGVLRSSRARFGCKLYGSTCSVPRRCCGRLKCYRKNGLYINFDKGVCVDCIGPQQVCQSDEQCCETLICDKERWNHVNGICGPKRRNGPCWEDEQCLAFCKVRGSGMYGRCY